MTDIELIAWARRLAESLEASATEVTPHRVRDAAALRRLADLAEQAAGEGETAWRPIETAPLGRALFKARDGKCFLGNRRPTGLWWNGLKRAAIEWRPLPPGVR